MGNSDNLEQNVDFIINHPAVKRDTDKVNGYVSGTGVTSDQVTARVKANIEKMIKPQITAMEALKAKMAEYKEKADKATDITRLEIYNAKIQALERELQKLNNIGKQGFDDFGNKIANALEKPIGQANRLNYALERYKAMSASSTNPALISKYNAKIQALERELQKLNNIGKQGFDDFGNKIANALEKPIGQANRLNYALERYKAMSASSTNPALISKYNAKIQETEGLLKRTANVGKEGFDQFGNAIAKNTNVVNKLWSGLRQAAVLIPGMGVAGILAFATEPIINFLIKLDLFKEKLTRLKMEQETYARALSGTDYAGAVKNVNELRINIEIAKKGLLDKKEVVNQYNETLGKTTGKVSTLLEAEKALIRNGEAYIKMTLLKATAQLALEDAAKQAYEAELVREKGRKTISDINDKSGYDNVTFGERLKIAFEQDQGYEKKVIADAAKRESSALDELHKNRLAIADKFQKQAATLAKKMGFDLFGGQYDDPKKREKSDKSASILQAEASLQERIQALKDKYARKSLDKDGEARQAILDEFKVLAAEIDKQAKIYDAYVKKYGKAKADKLGMVRPDASPLEPVKQAAIDDLVYRQETEYQKIALEKQKKNFEDYENFKLAFGAEKARERFGSEVKTNQDLLSKLRTDYAGLAIKSTFGGGLSGGESDRMKGQEKEIKELEALEAKRYADALQMAMTHSQKLELINEKYRDAVERIGKGITDDQKKVLLESRNAALDAAKDEALGKSAIYKKLAVDTIELTRKQVKEQIKLLEGMLSDGKITGEIKARLEKDLAGLKATLKLGVDDSNLEALKTKMAGLKGLLRDGKDSGNNILSEEETKKLLARIAELQARIDKLYDPKTGKAKSGFVQGLEENFRYLNGATKEVADGLSNDLGNISGSFNELSSALGGVNTEAGYTLDTIGRLVGVASDAAGAVGSFASGDIIGGISKSIKAITGLFSIGKRVKEMNEAARKEVEEYYKKAADGEREYQALLRKRELDTIKRGKNSYKAIIAELELLKKQSPEIQAAYNRIFASLQGQSQVVGVGYQHGTWFRKAKTWDIMASLAGSQYEDLEKLYTQGKLKDQAKADFESLRALREELQAAGLSIEDLNDQLTELVTGQNISSLADGLTQLFENGKFAAADFGKSFTEILRSSIVNGFKVKYLQDRMQPFLDELGELMKAGTPDPSVIEELRKKYESIGLEAADYWKELEKIFGGSLSNPNDKGSSGGISGEIRDRITEETGTKIEGVARAQYEVSKQHLGVGMAQLADMKEQKLSLEEIAKNTRETVEEAKNMVKELKDINKNTKQQGARALT